MIGYKMYKSGEYKVGTVVMDQRMMEEIQAEIRYFSGISNVIHLDKVLSKKAR